MGAVVILRPKRGQQGDRGIGGLPRVVRQPVFERLDEAFGNPIGLRTMSI